MVLLLLCTIRDGKGDLSRQIPTYHIFKRNGYRTKICVVICLLHSVVLTQQIVVIIWDHLNPIRWCDVLSLFSFPRFTWMSNTKLSRLTVNAQEEHLSVAMQLHSLYTASII